MSSKDGFLNVPGGVIDYIIDIIADIAVLGKVDQLFLLVQIYTSCF